MICRLGYTSEQVAELMGDRLDEFYEWMVGQTQAICEGRKYNHDTRKYEEACGGHAHGLIVYEWDADRFLAGLPAID